MPDKATDEKKSKERSFPQPRLPPLELVMKGDASQTVVAYACSKCGNVSTKDLAERCCAGTVCTSCGVALTGHRLTCTDCWNAKQAAIQARRVDKAARIASSEYHGALYCDSLGHNDGFFRDVDELAEYCNDEGIREIGPVFACHETRPYIDAVGAVEQALEEHHEDAEMVDIRGLEDFLKTWNAKQTDKTWTPDWRIVITGLDVVYVPEEGEETDE